MYTTGGLLPLLLAFYLRLCEGFQCHVCSYSASSDVSTDCIYAPDVLDRPGNFLSCNRTCIIQENFSLETQSVQSYIRSCSAVDKSGYCVQDAWSLVCFQSCLGELCNRYPGVLHEWYPVHGTQAAAADGSGVGGRNSGHSIVGAPGLLVFVVVFRYL